MTEGAPHDLFAPPVAQWRPVSPRLAAQRRLTLCGVALLLTAALLVMELLTGAARSLLAATGLTAVALVVWVWWLIGRNVASWGYAEREEDLYIKHGVMFRKLVAVPYGRMQYVDVNAGPLDQLFGIANVHLHTASPGTSARIPGLPSEEAARVRDRLTSLGEAQSAGL